MAPTPLPTGHGGDLGGDGGDEQAPDARAWQKMLKISNDGI